MTQTKEKTFECIKKETQRNKKPIKDIFGFEWKEEN